MSKIIIAFSADNTCLKTYCTHCMNTQQTHPNIHNTPNTKVNEFVSLDADSYYERYDDNQLKFCLSWMQSVFYVNTE